MLKFLSMTITNFGPYAGEQTVDFSGGDGVTLIWGDNGHGKTTLLNLFRYALFGKFQYRHDTIEDILKLPNKEGVNAGKYEFKVVLRMIHDGHHYELTRQYCLRSGISVPTKKDDYQQEMYLKVDGHFPANKEHELALIMPEDVSRFFLFDGELLQEYEELVKEEAGSGEKIKKSIETILGVPVLTNGATDTAAVLRGYRDEQTKAAQANTQTQKYAALIAAETAKKDEQSAELERLNNEYNEQLEYKAKLEDDGKQNEHLRALINDMEHLEGDIAEQEARRDGILQQIVVCNKTIWQSLISKQTSTLLEEATEEMNALQDKKYSHDAANQLLTYMQKIVATRHCDCCDQDVDETHVTALRERLAAEPGEYGGLSPEETMRLGDLQVKVASLRSMQHADETVTLKIWEDQLADVMVKIDDLNGQLRGIKSEIARYGSISDLSAAAKENAQNLAKCLQKIENLKEGIRQTKEKIREADSALNTLEEKVRRSGTTDAELNLAIERVRKCEAIHKIFDDGITAYREKLKNSVERDATELFCGISSDPDYVALKINDKYGLAIMHKSGDPIPLRSSGFEHIVALSLIGALHKNAPLSGPIIMDSPFGRLDPTHKKNITKSLPMMSDQVILLAHTDELDGQLAREVLGNNLKKEYRLRKYGSFHTEIEAQ